jgi:hypothetical protein
VLAKVISVKKMVVKNTPVQILPVLIDNLLKKTAATAKGITSPTAKIELNEKLG